MCAPVLPGGDAAKGGSPELFSRIDDKVTEDGIRDIAEPRKVVAVLVGERGVDEVGLDVLVERVLQVNGITGVARVTGAIRSGDLGAAHVTHGRTPRGPCTSLIRQVRVESNAVSADDSSVTLPPRPAAQGPVHTTAEPTVLVPTPRTPSHAALAAPSQALIPAAAAPTAPASSGAGKRRAHRAVIGSRPRAQYRGGWQSAAALGRGAALGIVAVATIAGSWSTVAALTGAPAMGRPAAVVTAPVLLDGAQKTLSEVYGIPGWTPLVMRDRTTGEVLDPTALAAQAARDSARAQAQDQRSQQARQEYLDTYGPEAARSLPQVASSCAPGKTLPAAAPLGSHPLADYNPRLVFGAEQITGAYCAGVGFVLDHGLHADLVRTPQARAADREDLAWTQGRGPGGFGGIRDRFTDSMRKVWDTWMSEPDQVLPGSGYGTGYENVRALSGIDTLVSLVDGTTLRVVDPAHAAPLIKASARLVETRMDRGPAPVAGGLGEPRLVLDIEVRGRMLMTRNPNGDPSPGAGPGSLREVAADLWSVPYVKTTTLALVPASGQQWLIDAATAHVRVLDLARADAVQVPTT